MTAPAPSPALLAPWRIGVDVGGMSRTEAVQVLQADLARRADRFAGPVSVKVGEQAAQIKPVDVGLAVDVEATVAAAAATKPSCAR